MLADDLSSEMQYVDLTLNPERFTGYSGPSAARIWRAIYEENCFNLDARALAQPSPAAPQTPGADADASGTARRSFSFLLCSLIHL